MELFRKSDVDTYLKHKKQVLQDEISKISDNDILTLNFDELVDYYLKKHTILPVNILYDSINPTLDKTKIEKSNPFRCSYEPESFFVDGYVINYIIPCEGDYNLLFLKPTLSISRRFEVETIKNMGSTKELPTISFSIEIESDILEKSENPQELINQKFESEFSGFKTMIGHVNDDVNRYNERLKKVITDLLTDKKDKSEKFNSLISKINIPLKLNENLPNVVPITLSLQNTTPKYPEKRKL